MHGDALLAHFSGASDAPPLYLPNLTLWYGWHARQGTLPRRWAGMALPQICRELDVPVWDVARPFTVDAGAVSIEREEAGGQRLITYQAASGTLVERWELGPDGDWWQSEYAVKGRADLAILLEIIEARRYLPHTAQLDEKRQALGERGLLALELPRRPFAQVCLEWLGWSDGLLLLWDEPDLIAQIMAVLEGKLQALVPALAAVAGPILVSPDNLDAQFISPPLFQQYLAESYRMAAAVAKAQGRLFLVDTGGPIRKLLEPLSAAGVDGVQGVCGPPQSDATLAEARALVGPDFTLWGGIPQDALQPTFPLDQFERAVKQAAVEARDAGRSILGVADRVPVGADSERLRAIPSLIAQALQT